MMRRTKALLAVILLSFLPSLAQTPPAKIHGHVQDPAGAAIPNATVKLSTDAEGKSKVSFSFPTDANGDYKGDGVAPGTYFITLISEKNLTIDQFPNIKIAAGGDIVQDFDLGRPEYVAKLTPEQRKVLEEAKKKNAAVTQENAQIKNLNATLIKARDDNKQKNYAEAETLMTQATTQKPDAAVLWLELGVAQSGLKKSPDAVTSLKKAVDLETASKKPNPDIIGEANNTIGNTLATTDVTAAESAYAAAVAANPPAAGRYYLNAAIVLDRAGKPDESVAEAEKAIAADPKLATAYYLKGKGLITKVTLDPKTQKPVAPEGCFDAYQKYLELAPDGPMAPEVKEILTGMGQPIKSTYKAGKR